jgi:hypothetical protein
LGKGVAKILEDISKIYTDATDEERCKLMSGLSLAETHACKELSTIYREAGLALDQSHYNLHYHPKSYFDVRDSLPKRSGMSKPFEYGSQLERPHGRHSVRDPEVRALSQRIADSLSLHTDEEREDIQRK